MNRIRIMNTKSQSWSMDMIFGVVIFLTLAIVFLGFMLTSGSDFNLRSEADNIFARLDSDSGFEELTVLEGNSISLIRLEILAQEDYTELKSLLGVNSDFCIVLVDSDGGIINISSERTSIGNPDHRISISEGIMCGE